MLVLRTVPCLWNPIFLACSMKHCRFAGSASVFSYVKIERKPYFLYGFLQIVFDKGLDRGRPLPSVEPAGEGVHVVADTGLGDSGVDLRGTDILVAEHFTDRFEGYAVGERNRGREGMPRKVECHPLVYPADRRDLLQVVVDLLIGGDVEEFSVTPGSRILFDDA